MEKESEDEDKAESLIEGPKESMVEKVLRLVKGFVGNSCIDSRYLLTDLQYF